jgi:hypothetical protein
MQHPAFSGDRRRFARNPAKAHAFVHCHGHFQSATVIDFSQGGLQLEGTFALFKGDAVEIELLSGIRVSGSVAWSLGARTGIAFSNALPETHPATAELARSATRLSVRHAAPSIGGSSSYGASGVRA